MKCRACYTDNVNEAAYCRNCGKNIRETYIGNTTQKTAMSVPILIGFLLVVASCVVCGSKISKLFEHKKLSAHFRDKETYVATYYDEEQQTAYAYIKGNEETVKVKIYDGGEYTTEYEGNGYKILRGGNGKQYVVNSMGVAEIESYQDFKVSEGNFKMAYLTEKRELYVVKGSSKSMVSENVLDYVVSQDGSYVAYLKDDKAEAMEKNAFYKDGKELAIDSAEKPCKLMLCANGYGVYYINSDSELIVIPQDTTDGKSYKSEYKLKSIDSIIAVGTNSIMFAAEDDNTYIWEKNKDERLFYKETIYKMLVPHGTQFVGDDYSKLIYQAYSKDSIYADETVYIYTDKKDKLQYETLCKDAKLLATSGDSTFLYYTDKNDDLWRIDVTGGQEEIKCGEGVKSIEVSNDGRELWYTSNDGLYYFDGMRTEELAPLSDAEVVNMCVSSYGYLVLETEDSLFIFNDELIEIMFGKDDVQAIYSARDCSYYIVDDEIYFAREDGRFMTDAEVAEENGEDTEATDSSNAGNSDNAKSDTED